MNNKQPFSYKSKKKAQKAQKKRDELTQLHNKFEELGLTFEFEELDFISMFELTQLHNELEELGFMLTIEEITSEKFIYRLKMGLETIYIILESNNTITIVVYGTSLNDELAGKKTEYAIYQTMKYIASVLNLEEIKAEQFVCNGTIWFDGIERTFAFSQKIEIRQMIVQALKAISDMLEDDERFDFYHILQVEEDVYHAVLEDKQLESRDLHVLDYSVDEEEYVVDDEFYTLEEILEFFKMKTGTSISNQFNVEETKLLLERYGFKVTNELSVISKNLINVFSDDVEVGFTQFYISYLSNEAILLQFGRTVRLYESKDAFLQEQEINFQRYLAYTTKIAHQTNEKLTHMFDDITEH